MFVLVRTNTSAADPASALREKFIIAADSCELSSSARVRCPGFHSTPAVGSSGLQQFDAAIFGSVKSIGSPSLVSEESRSVGRMSRITICLAQRKREEHPCRPRRARSWGVSVGRLPAWSRGSVIGGDLPTNAVPFLAVHAAGWYARAYSIARVCGR